MDLQALFLNCTLKYSPETSNTRAFVAQAEKIFHSLNVSTEVVRVNDFQVKWGTSSGEGDNDEWPQILEKIKAADIFVLATPVWRGDRSSVAKMVAERLDGIWDEGNEKNGQYPTYNKVGGCLVDGNEDGAKKAISSILFDMSEHGFTIPVNAFSYYVGKAGPGPSYIEAGGDKHKFTNKMLLQMAYNMVHIARLLKEAPYPTNLSKLNDKAKDMSE